MIPKTRTGIEDFKKLLFHSNLFVDKTLFIKEILENSGDAILITRPRRWGKSMNLSMLKYFLEIEVDAKGIPIPLEQSVNRKLFLGGEVDLGLGLTKELNPLNIASDSMSMRYQGQFPVILVSFKEAKGSSYEEIEDKIKLQILKLYGQYRYLEQYLAEDNNTLSKIQKIQLGQYFSGDFNKQGIENSLAFLSEILTKHFGKNAYILIDEYDTPINHTYITFGSESKELTNVLNLFRSIFGASLKGNGSLERGIITGILRIAKANLFSDINNVSENTLLDENFAKSYGFTQDEVDELLRQYPTETLPEKIKLWYNGYNFGGETIYNPWSIMMCLSRKGKLDNYWIDSGGTDLVDKALTSDESQEDLQKLADGKTINSPITKQISFEDIGEPIGLYSLLLFSGYLNPNPVDIEENIYELSAPNKEVLYIYKTRMLRWVTNKLKTDRSRYYSFVTLLASGKIEEFKEQLQEFLQNATSFFQTGEKKAEVFYSGFMLCLINTISTTHIVDSERESGNGRPDIVLIPKPERNNNLAIIIEYKISKTIENLKLDAQTALDQIQAQKYDIKLKAQPHIKQIFKIGIAFFRKNVEMVYVEEKISKEVYKNL